MAGKAFSAACVCPLLLVPRLRGDRERALLPYSRDGRQGDIAGVF